MKLGLGEASLLQTGCFLRLTPQGCLIRCHQLPIAVDATSLILPNSLAMSIPRAKLKGTRIV